MGIQEIINKNTGKKISISFGEIDEDGVDLVQLGIIKSIYGKWLNIIPFFNDEEEEPIYINMDTIRFFTINPRIIYENGKKVLMVEKIKVKKDE